MLIALSELVGCGDPGVPANGYKIGDNYWAGQVVTFACDTGYHLEGPSNRLCLQDGNWSDTMPTCETSKFCSIRSTFINPIFFFFFFLFVCFWRENH